MYIKADAGADITIQQGDSAFIGSYTNGIDSLMWLENGMIKKDSTRPGFYVHPSLGTTYYVLQQTVNGCFSSDTVYVNVVVPLKFISYSVISNAVRNLEKSVENIWATANEVNVSHYNIQRSTNSKDFTTIGTVKAHNKNYYTYTDESTRNEKQETWYYRIEAIDNDGKKTYSTIQQITNEKRETRNVVIFPNPATTTVNIASQQNIQQIKIINQFGQTIQQFNNPTQLLTLNSKLLTKGVYIVQAISRNAEIFNQKLIIE